MASVKDRNYIAIDLKSFYASVECVERGLDPFQVNLVVADPTRSVSTICLAITPAMKKLGVKNRCRIHEIPPDVKYITAMPRMQLYIDYSVRIYGIYLRYFSPDDIHVYSIDECFIDVSDYMDLYGKTARELAVLLMKEVMRETGICATAGIGTNLYLCKIAMDIVAKHVDDHIGFLDEMEYREKMWGHRPLTDFWRIGPGTARTLGRYGIFTMGDIARTSLKQPEWLQKLFGIDAELLIDHAWGYEPCTMKDIKTYVPETNSLSSGQVLMRNYSFEEAWVIVREMTDQLILDLVDKGLVTNSVSLYISYDHRSGVPSGGKGTGLNSFTNSTSLLLATVEALYKEITDRYTGIRRINVCFGRLRPEEFEQLDLFTDDAVNPHCESMLLDAPLCEAPSGMAWVSRREARIREKNIQNAILEIRRRYGANAIMRGCNLLKCSNYRERNMQIGGHRA
ncbi:MAG: DNA repair protein [Lachnospiraceae bacterium]|nr:DNA repair protein [Lachnospiraceae bacterium]